MKRTRIHFIRPDFGIINGYRKILSKADALKYFLKYAQLNIIHHKGGYWERI